MLLETPSDRLRRAVARMKCIDDPDATWLADGITAVLAGDQGSLDEALGLRLGPGQRHPATLARLAERDKLYRRAAQEFFPGLNPTRQAHELHRAFSRYETTAWRFDKGGTVTCPPQYAGTVRALAWKILNLTDRVQSERSIRQILATNCPYSSPRHLATTNQRTRP